MNEKVIVPSVLGVRRALVCSDGLFYGVDRGGQKKLIPVIRHGIRGAQNQSKGATDVNLVQRTESAKTFHDTRMLEVSFSLRPLPLVDGLTSCSGRDAAHFKSAFERFVANAESGNGLLEVCRRMARNLFNGRWLWRNRQLGVSIIVEVKSGDVTWRESVLGKSLNDFGAYTEAEIAVGDIFAEQFYGATPATMEVTAYIDLGMTGSVEVYPSQNFVHSKPDGFARSLYKVDVRKIPRGTKESSPDTFEDAVETGLAALRDQKIWNALRTIDTWYADYAETRLPIPVEPLGASLSADTFYRYYKNTSMFDLLPRLGVLDTDSDEGMFAISCLIRGGVLGIGDEEKKADKAAKAAEKKAAKNVKNANAVNDADPVFALNGGDA
jgi:CRISPR-associated protein Csy3